VTIEIELEKKHSKQNTATIVSYILAHPSLMKELMQCFFTDNIMICQYASCAVELIVKEKPQLIAPYFTKMVKCLAMPKQFTLVRNVLRVFQQVNIPAKYQGEVFERCYQYIATPQTPVAIRAFSITVCYNIAKEIPELKNELALTIEAYMENSLPAFRSRGGKVLSQIRSNATK
jgi:hypothetical protein